MDTYRIEELVDTGKYEEALREVDKAFGLGLTEADLYLCRGRAYIGLQRYEQAVRDLDEAIALGLKEPVVYDGRGFAHFELGHYQCAKKDFDEAIRLGLEEARAWWGESGEEHLYESNDPLRYSMAGVYFFRGQTHLELSDYEKAVSDFNESIRLKSWDEDNYVGRGNAYLGLGLADKARQDFDKAEELRCAQDRLDSGTDMPQGYEHPLPEELGEFSDVLLDALSRVLRDLAVAPPEMHHREWILVHLIAFIRDEADRRDLSPDILEDLEAFHRVLVQRADAEWS